MLIKCSYPCKKSFWIFKSSANEPANWSNVAHWFIWMAPSVVPCRVLHPSEFVSKSWVVYWFQLGSKSTTDGIGLNRPTELAFDEALCRKSGDNWKPVLWTIQKKIVINSIEHFDTNQRDNWSYFRFNLWVQRNHLRWSRKDELSKLKTAKQFN